MSSTCNEPADTNLPCSTSLSRKFTLGHTKFFLCSMDSDRAKLMNSLFYMLKLILPLNFSASRIHLKNLFNFSGI